MKKVVPKINVNCYYGQPLLERYIKEKSFTVQHIVKLLNHHFLMFFQNTIQPKERIGVVVMIQMITIVLQR